jgi:hypothetical protein
MDDEIHLDQMLSGQLQGPSGRHWSASRSAATTHAACGHQNHDERLWRGVYEREARGTRQGRADASTDKGKGHHGNGGPSVQLLKPRLSTWGSVGLISSKWLRG